MKNSIYGKKLLSLSALVAIFFSCAASASAQIIDEPPYNPNPNAPKTFYVSKNGDNSDGRSWNTAWNEMNQIHWDQINPMHHDSIILDGGEKRMVYQTPLVVSMTPFYYPTPITVSTEAGRSGQVLIAPGNAVNGIEVSGSVQLNGSKRNGIRVYGAKTGLKITSSGPYPFSVKNIELSHCAESGMSINASYYPVSLSQLVVHDNAANVVVAQSGGAPGAPQLSKCWIYNSSYSVNSDGVRVDGTVSGPPMPGVSLTNCVLGPGLRDGLNNTSSARPSLTNCLLINATRKNVNTYSANLQNVTSFMTPMNPSHQSHSCIKLQGTGLPYGMPGSNVKQSIIFGGMVEIPTTISFPYPPYTQAFPITVEQNTQFRTTGNTTVLAPTLENPLFVTPVGLLPNITPIPLLMALDFSLRPNSPAQGTGSSITSIQNLLNSFD